MREIMRFSLILVGRYTLGPEIPDLLAIVCMLKRIFGTMSLSPGLEQRMISI